MYMVDHDIVLIADIATPTNWTRHRDPFAVYMSQYRVENEFKLRSCMSCRFICSHGM